MVDVEVRSRVTGTSGGPPPVLVRLASEQTTVRELIRRTVSEQVRLAGEPEPHRRPSLSDDEILAARSAGAVRPPRPVPDVADEVSRAHRAFTRGTFAVFVGGRQVTGLDEQVTVGGNEPVVFLRLVALAGG